MPVVGVDSNITQSGQGSNLSKTDPKIKLPNLNLGFGLAELIMDGDTVGFSIGIPLYSKKTETEYVEKGNNLPNSKETPKIEKISKTKTGNTFTESRDALNDMKNAVGFGEKGKTRSPSFATRQAGNRIPRQPEHTVRTMLNHRERPVRKALILPSI